MTVSHIERIFQPLQNTIFILKKSIMKQLLQEVVLHSCVSPYSANEAEIISEEKLEKK